MSYQYNGDCRVCDGDGYHEIGPDCNRPASDCCGGCYKTVVCSNCSGTGRVSYHFRDYQLCDIIEGIYRENTVESVILVNQIMQDDENS